MKEYKDRHLKPLVNPPITIDKNKPKKARSENCLCASCGQMLDFTDQSFNICSYCGFDNFRKGN